jgi:hypothetical protein
MMMRGEQRNWGKRIKRKRMCRRSRTRPGLELPE